MRADRFSPTTPPSERTLRVFVSACRRERREAREHLRACERLMTAADPERRRQLRAAYRPRLRQLRSRLEFYSGDALTLLVQGDRALQRLREAGGILVAMRDQLEAEVSVDRGSTERGR